MLFFRDFCVGELNVTSILKSGISIEEKEIGDIDSNVKSIM
jgi:hypothetical protein